MTWEGRRAKSKNFAVVAEDKSLWKGRLQCFSFQLGVSALAKISCDFYPFLTAARNFSVFGKKGSLCTDNTMTLLMILLTKGQTLGLCVLKKKRKKINQVNKKWYILANAIFI